jgi:hypothetical protein
VPWFRVDDGFHSHPKVMATSFAAIGLWVRAGSWCSKHLTDGVVPTQLLRSWRAPVKLAVELVTAGLWMEHPDGYQFHDWKGFNPSKSDVVASRAAAAERQRRSRGGHSVTEARQCVHDVGPVTGASRRDRANGHSVTETTVTRDLAHARDPVPTLPGPAEAEPPPAAGLTEAELEAEGRALSRRWRMAHEAAAVAMAHGFELWRAEFEAAARALITLAGADRATAAAALCAWWWTAPDGPIRDRRVLSGKATPRHLAKGITADLVAARAWWDGLADQQRQTVLDRGGLPEGREAAE